jgi:hypothetical protein
MELQSLEKIVGALNGAQVRYLIVGGLAVNAHGFVRPTKDVDLVIQLDYENIQAALTALATIDYHPFQPVTAKDMANPEKRREWRESKGMIVLKLWSDLHRETPVDVFIEEPFDFNREYARAKPQQLSDTLEAPTVALGTLLKMKAEAGRPRDQEDISALKELHGL